MKHIIMKGRIQNTDIGMDNGEKPYRRKVRINSLAKRNKKFHAERIKFMSMICVSRTIISEIMKKSSITVAINTQWDWDR